MIATKAEFERATAEIHANEEIPDGVDDFRLSAVDDGIMTLNSRLQTLFSGFASRWMCSCLLCECLKKWKEFFMRKEEEEVMNAAIKVERWQFTWRHDSTQNSRRFSRFFHPHQLLSFIIDLSTKEGLIFVRFLPSTSRCKQKKEKSQKRFSDDVENKPVAWIAPGNDRKSETELFEIDFSPSIYSYNINSGESLKRRESFLYTTEARRGPNH